VVERIFAEKKLFGGLRQRRYDLIVHLSEQPRGAWLARWLGARYSVAPKIAGRGGFWQRSFTHFYPLVPRRHMVEVNLDALRRIGVQPGQQERKVTFVPGAQAEQAVDKLLDGRPFVHLHPASRWRFKCWTAQKNAELIDRLAADGHRVVVTAAPDEAPMVDEILGKAKAAALNLAGKLTLKQLGAVAARARLFVGVDSMPMHLAAAMGVPTVALFGPSGESEWGPWNVAHRVVTSAHPCRPCGQDGCGGGKVSECLTLLPVDSVHAAVRELLGASAR
jgi:heptosyltransferase-3